MNIQSLFAKHVAGIEPYRAVNTTGPSSAADALKLDWNESTVPPPPSVIRSVMDYIQGGSLHLYPDIDPAELRELVARYCEVGEHQVELFNGSDTAHEYICRSLIDPGDEVVVFQPTYDNFRVSALASGARVKQVRLPDPFEFDVDLAVRNIDARTKLVYLVNPNNPTGYLVSSEEIRALLQKLRRGILLVDEAYFEFCGVSAKALLAEHRNLVLTRSLSKAFGLAAIRMGYVLAGAEVIAQLNRIRNPKHINGLAHVAAVAALRDTGYVQRFVAAVNDARGYVAREFPRHGLQVRLTPANFFMLRVSDPAEALAALQARNIFVRDRSSIEGLSGYLRITLGTVVQMDRVLTALLDANIAEPATADTDRRRKSYRQHAAITALGT